MQCENPNKKIIEDFIAAAVALLEQERKSVQSLLEDLSGDEEWNITNSEGVKFTYTKTDYPDHFCIIAKSDLMQEYHVLPETN